MYDNIVFIKDDIIYDTIDGCSKQYRSANEMWLLSVLLFTCIMIIYACINGPGHGRIKIGGIHGSGKTQFKKICMIEI